MENEPRTAIESACKLLFSASQVTELRILGINNQEGFLAGGWFDDMQLLTEAAIRNERRRPHGIYVVMNPVTRSCLARTENTIVDRQRHGTADREIASRNWLLVDLDAARPTGISSTDAEIEETVRTSQLVRSYLEGEQGFPAGVEADSGNGRHILYRIDEPNDDETADVLANILKVLKSLFETSAVLIDTTVYNAARITKLYGTLARKGANTTDRPHRRSCILTNATFADVEIVDRAKLEKVAKLVKKTEAKKKRTKAPEPVAAAAPFLPAGDNPDHAVDLDAWIRQNGIGVARTEPWRGGTRYILDRCIFDPTHVGTSAAMGRSAAGQLFYKCQHNSCANRRWADAKKLIFGTVRTSGRSIDHPPREKKAKRDEENPYDMAKTFLDDLHSDGGGKITLRRWRQEFYSWGVRRGCYRKLEEDMVKVQVTRWLGERGEKVTSRAVYDVITSVQSLITVDSDAEAPFISTIDPDTHCVSTQLERRPWITMANGIADVSMITDNRPLGECLRPQTPDWFSLNALPFALPQTTEDAFCDLWIEFLEETFNDQSTRDLMQEAFGYCFDLDLRLEAFFVLHGKGRNGKSTMMDVLTSLLGEENVSSVSPEDFSNSYMLYELYGKLANICGDLTEMDRMEEGIIKSLTSGDAIHADRKYKSPVRFRFHGKLWFATNPLPRLSDTSLGIWRKMKLIPFDNVVPEEKVDIDLGTKLQRELPGIFLWALNGLARLRRNKKFSESPRCKTALYDYRVHNFPVLTYLDECTTRDPDRWNESAKVSSEELWKSYCKWCQLVGLIKLKPLHTFIGDVLSFRPEVQIAAGAKTPRNQAMIHGLRIVDFPPYSTDTKELWKES